MIRVHLLTTECHTQTNPSEERPAGAWRVRKTGKEGTAARPRVQIIGPSIEAPGGVANYYDVLLPRLQRNSVFDIGYTAIGSGRRGRPPWYIVSDQWRAYWTIRRLRPAIVHVNPTLASKSFWRDALIILGAKRQGAKVLVFFRGWSKDFERAVDGSLARIFATSYAKADGFIVLAREFADKLRSWGIQETKIHLSTTVVDDEHIDEVAVQARLDELRARPALRPLKLLFMARLAPRKGALETVHAVAQLVHGGIAVELTVAGSGPAEAEIHRYLHSASGATAPITLVGHVSGAEKTRLLLSHDLFCLPTLGEGMPNSVLEAMAFGMGVITSPVGGLKDFFQPQQMGAFVSGDNVQEIMAAIRALSADRARLAEIGHFNFNYARSRFYASTIAHQIEGIYRHLLRVSPS